MEFVICKHRKAKSSLVSVTSERDNGLIVLTRVPADVSKNRGEYYLNESVTEYLLNCPKEAVNKPIWATWEYYIQAINKLFLNNERKYGTNSV
jgi:hypothetical protein